MPEWAFMRLGYSECFDAFFTFALFAIARDSGFFPAVLVEKFEPVMQEEARHILFFVNWEAYRQAQRPLWQRPYHVWRGALGRVLQVWRRVQGALGARADKDFTMKGHQSMRMDITPRRFLELCLAENARRLDRATMHAYCGPAWYQRLLKRCVRCCRSGLRHISYGGVCAAPSRAGVSRVVGLARYCVTLGTCTYRSLDFNVVTACPGGGLKVYGPSRKWSAYWRSGLYTR